MQMDSLVEICTVQLQPYKTKSYQKEVTGEGKLAKK